MTVNFSSSNLMQTNGSENSTRDSRTRPSPIRQSYEKTLFARRGTSNVMSASLLSVSAQPLDADTAMSLREMLFGSAATRPDWLKSGFAFKEPNKLLAYGFKPQKNNTRALIVCVNAHIIKYLLFKLKYHQKCHFEVLLKPNLDRQIEAFVNSLSEIVWRAGDYQKVSICLIKESKVVRRSDVTTRDGVTEKLHFLEFTEFGQVLNFFNVHYQMFAIDEGYGCLLFLYSLILTKGPDRIRKELTEDTQRLLSPNGDCTTATINLVLTGRATPYLHNGIAYVGSEDAGVTKALVGIENRSELGLLLGSTNQDSAQIGSRLKTPSLPIWITCVNSHYGILFNPNKDLIRDYHAEKRFDLHYYSCSQLQIHPTILNIETRFTKQRDEQKFRPPLESLILSKWQGAQIDWNGTPPYVMTPDSSVIMPDVEKENSFMLDSTGVRVQRWKNPLRLPGLKLERVVRRQGLKEERLIKGAQMTLLPREFFGNRTTVNDSASKMDSTQAIDMSLDDIIKYNDPHVGYDACDEYFLYNSNQQNQVQLESSRCKNRRRSYTQFRQKNARFNEVTKRRSFYEENDEQNEGQDDLEEDECTQSLPNPRRQKLEEGENSNHSLPHACHQETEDQYDQLLPSISRKNGKSKDVFSRLGHNFRYGRHRNYNHHRNLTNANTPSLTIQIANNPDRNQPNPKREIRTKDKMAAFRGNNVGLGHLSSGWREEILTLLQHRNRSQHHSYRDLIALHNRLFENSDALKLQNLHLTIQNEKLRQENLDLQMTSNVSNGRPNEKTLALEQKLFRLQEELTELHRRKGENAQQLVDMKNALQDKDKELSQKESSLRDSERLLKTLADSEKKLLQTLSELEMASQLLRDEHQALQLAYTSMEKRMRELHEENQDLVKRWMKQKAVLADRLNDENEVTLRRHQAKLQKDLADAACEPFTIFPEKTTFLEPNICLKISLPSGVLVKFDAHDGEVHTVKWSPSGRVLATGGADRRVKLWDIVKGSYDQKGMLTGSNAAVMSIDFDTEETLLLGASNDFASRVWTISDLRLRHTLTGHSNKVSSAKFLGDANKVVSGSHDRTLKIWDLRTHACVKTIFAMSSCFDVVTDRPGTTIISGHFDKRIRFWDTRSDSSTNEVVLQGKVTSLDISTDGIHLLTCTRDDILKMLDLRMNQVVGTFSAEGFKVGCDWTRAVFSPDTQYVTVGSSDGTIFIWNSQDCKLEKSLKEHRYKYCKVIAFGIIMVSREERYAFIAEWYDSTAAITRKFQLFYYPTDGSIEMYDTKARRPFLKRMPYDKIALRDFYIGNTMMILSRRMDIVDYGDDLTRSRLERSSEKTLAIIINEGLKYMGRIFDDIYNVLRLQISQAIMTELTKDQASEFCSRQSTSVKGLLRLDKLTCGRVVLLELLGENGVRKWCDYLGLPIAEDKADCQAVPTTIGSDKLAAVCYGSESVGVAVKDRKIFTDFKLKNTATFHSCTCCVIKPHAIQSGLAGGILSAILDAGFYVSALKLFHMEVTNAEEFYEVYKGVVSEYKDMVHQLVSGPCIAMEIISNFENTPKAFREVVGPIDPDIARQLRPTTIRSRFGKDRVNNAVHCTDLPDDALLEVEYFFKILAP
uniref:DM10 domain-containing protein n=1 Tax=Strigamia maritima TaxID=126957 RepID=T1IVG0_STRMM